MLKLIKNTNNIKHVAQNQHKINSRIGNSAHHTADVTSKNTFSSRVLKPTIQ